MNYEINISKHGKHLFATAARSCQTEQAAQRVYNELSERFSQEEGYKITVTRWETTGTEIDLSENNKED